MATITTDIPTSAEELAREAFPPRQVGATNMKSSMDSNQLGKLAGDLAAAIISATLVAPTVTILDRAIVETVSTQKSLLQGLRSHAIHSLRYPGRFVFSRPFGLVWALYAGTYTVANTTETLTADLQASTAGTVTFISTMMVNVPLGVLKDLKFAQYFGTIKAVSTTGVPLLPPKVPRAVTASFLARDAVTIFGSFTLAPRLATTVPDSLTTNPHAKTTITQLTVPMLSQIVATPIHLLGLDFHNHHDGLSLARRFSRLREHIASTTVVRCIRILPAFGFGCLSNVEMRAFFHSLAETKNEYS